jgi:hypothetical protein
MMLGPEELNAIAKILLAIAGVITAVRGDRKRRRQVIGLALVPPSIRSCS